MKKRLVDYIEMHKEETIALGRRLFECPELGFKEYETIKILKETLLNAGFKIEKTFAKTGFQVKIGSGKPHIGLLAELDGIVTLNHPYASKEDVAHSCGHHSQCAIMVSSIKALKELDLKGSISLFFTPAEEYTDLEERYKMIENGEIRYPSGKIQMLYEGAFDDVDCLIHLHASTNPNYSYSTDTKLAGFIYKKFSFLGKAAHAAVLPHEGINALNACNLFLNAVNMLRETFKEEDHIRFHGFIKEGGQTINAIPERVIYEAYVRAYNSEALVKLSDQLSNTAIYAAKAINASCDVEDRYGYYPFEPSPLLARAVEENILAFESQDRIKKGGMSIAAGDVGDLSLFKPLVQFGYGGFKGRIHGSDFRTIDEDKAYIEPSKIVAMTVYDLLTDEDKCLKIIENFKPKMDKETYFRQREKE